MFGLNVRSAVARTTVNLSKQQARCVSQAVVKISYEDLISNKDLTEQIDEAFNFNGYGLIAVEGVPEVIQKRVRILRLGYEFSQLPEEVKQKYEHPPSFFSVGWSHGKEVLEDSFDLSKGSWYSNPLLNVPTTDPELIKKYPSYYTANIWPSEVPDMEPAFKDMGKTICDVGALVGKQMDKFVVAQCPGYKADTLTDILENSTVPKGRLLHYFPQDVQEKAEQAAAASSWCGWHNDHGALTGLTSAMFLNKQGEEINNPDPKSGLYAKMRTGTEQHITYPRDCLAFQVGEAAQILSGGLLQATPHAVMGPTTPESANISRETLAVFMQPMPDFPMSLPEGRTREDAQRGSSKEFLPPTMPDLALRWDPDNDFGTFTNRTLNFYH